MALTITSQPVFLSPVYADHTYTIHDSGRANNADLYYELDIIVGSVTRTLRQLPDINKQASINIAKILQGFIESELFIHDFENLFYPQSFGCVNYHCVARSVSGGTTLEDRSLDKWVFNGTIQYDKYWTVTDYFTTVGEKSKWLNDWKGVKRIHPDDEIYLQTFVGQYDTVLGLTWQPTFAGISVTLKYKNGSTATHTFSYTQTSQATILSINVGLKSLKYFYPSLDITNVDYYEVKEINNYIDPVRIYVSDPDERYDRYFRIAFLGPLGTTEMFNFDLDNRNSLNVSKTEFRNANLSRIYNVNVEDTYKVTSDYITEDEAQDLKYLWLSPVVMVYETGDYITDKPIIVEDKSVSVLKRRNQKLINYEMNFRYAYKYVNYRQ